MKTALSIAGSDSGAGAGIQADLKTFAALGLHGCTVITALTSQNTVSVSRIFEIPGEVVKSQLVSILTDMPPAAAKLGMLYSKEIIAAVVDGLAGAGFPLVVDPILSAGTGAPLLRPDAVGDFIKSIIPMSFAITPNRAEAEYLSGVRISGEDDTVKAAERIMALGARNVIVKGGHFEQDHAVDLLLTSENRRVLFSNPRIEVGETHGSGCNFSAALTAFIAGGMPLEKACKAANSYVHDALLNLTRVGSGLPVTNPLAALYLDAQKYNVIRDLRAAVRNLVKIRGFGSLVPETQTNFAYALPGASKVQEVAAVRGRIVRAGSEVIAVSDVDFAESRHVAAAIVEYMKFDPTMRSAINMKFDSKVLNACMASCRVASYDRQLEPREVKSAEGSSVPWGIRSALSDTPAADVIYHTGDVGKEAMTMVFGSNPAEVVDKVTRISTMYSV
ncbi:MAG: bifunctional hydroxymethylpyrimidine kinase/phosphomethylpyrimidine kinase [Nitrososphaera sp.]|jgi:hydroxymethylpyrimidine/phosphomethylpyrimidine kinase